MDGLGNCPPRIYEFQLFVIIVGDQMKELLLKILPAINTDAEYRPKV